MNRKLALILGLVAVIFVAALSIGAISAENIGEITVKGEKFYIPDGYIYTQHGILTSGDTEARAFEKSGDYIIINVNTSSNKAANVQLKSGEVKKTINGVEGNYNPNTHVFTYVHENNTISIQAPSEQVIGEVMGGGFLNFNFNF